MSEERLETSCSNCGRSYYYSSGSNKTKFVWCPGCRTDPVVLLERIEALEELMESKGEK